MEQSSTESRLISTRFYAVGADATLRLGLGQEERTVDAGRS
jgi:hypothetical protein